MTERKETNGAAVEETKSVFLWDEVETPEATWNAEQLNIKAELNRQTKQV